MAHFDHALVGDDGFLTQVGTLSGNPVASVAGLASLAILKRPGAYRQIFETGGLLMAELDRLLKRAGIPPRSSANPRCSTSSSPTPSRTTTAAP